MRLNSASILSFLKNLCVASHKFFRIGKSNLEMRPMFHFTPKRIEAHICICFVAYSIQGVGAYTSNDGNRNEC